MTTFGTFDIDTVPAPSDIELAPSLTVAVTAPWRYPFNGATRALNIGRDRFRFHTWCEHSGVDVTPTGSYTEDEWWELYHHFVPDVVNPSLGAYFAPVALAGRQI